MAGRPVITFDFRTDDIDERGEQWRRAQEADPVAVAHLARRGCRLMGTSRWSGQAGQGGHLRHFLVATAAVVALLHLQPMERQKR